MTVAMAKYDELPREQQIQHNALLAHLGIIEYSTRKRQQGHLLTAVESAQNHLLPERKAVEALFNGSAKKE